MFRDLLVHVDGSEAGRRRVKFSVDLALRTGARLSGLHVMPPPDVPPLYKPSQMDEAIANMSLKLASNARAAKEAFHEEVAQRLTIRGGSGRMVMLSMVLAIAPAMPTWSSLASTSGRARWWPTRCRSPTPLSCVAVARYLLCPRPLDQFRSIEPRLHGMAAVRQLGRCMTPSRCWPCRSRSKS